MICYFQTWLWVEVILPEPASCIYIIDEAHHIAEKTRNHFTLHSGVTGTLQWLDTVVNTLGTMTQQFSRPKGLLTSRLL